MQAFSQFEPLCVCKRVIMQVFRFGKLINCLVAAFQIKSAGLLLERVQLLCMHGNIY